MAKLVANLAARDAGVRREAETELEHSVSSPSPRFGRSSRMRRPWRPDSVWSGSLRRSPGEA